ncbi:hypothetical protein [Robertkochia aurantiaca]|uniref:hypothetical protein n=1 Tax=Robertkochia aurantiaca TaxID=2873700 RepID=UPI001CC908B0|nr:hypothetical protein [Robertkochia sp. 3YJGBD-33]
MPILHLDLENFNGKKLLFVLTLEEYHEQDYITFFIDNSDDLWFQDRTGLQPIEELSAIGIIALYEALPEEVKTTPQYVHVPMLDLVEDYLKITFGKGITHKR